LAAGRLGGEGGALAYRLTLLGSSHGAPHIGSGEPRGGGGGGGEPELLRHWRLGSLSVWVMLGIAPNSDSSPVAVFAGAAGAMSGDSCG
jgi:hypothetical protein